VCFPHSIVYSNLPVILQEHGCANTMGLNQIGPLNEERRSL